MRKLTALIKNHRLAITLAIIIAFIYVSHHAVLERELKNKDKEYLPVLTQTDDRQFILPKVKYVFDNGVMSGDVATKEYAGSKTFLPPLPHYILGYISRIIGSLKWGFIISSFILPPIIFLLLYLLAFEITRKKGISLLFATVSSIIPRYLAFFPLFNKYYQAWFIDQLINLQQRLPFNRLEDPMLTLPFFILFLYLFVRTINRLERYTPYFAALSFSLLFYTYFYYYVYSSAALFVAIIFFLLYKDFINVKRVSIIFFGGLILSIPYWKNLFELQKMPFYEDIVSRIGPEKGYNLFTYPRVIFAYIQHLGLAILSLVWFKKYSRPLAIFFSSILLPVFAVYNFQIITGFNPQPDHWIKPTQVILTLTFIIFFWYAIRKYVGSLKNIHVLSVVSLVLIIFIYKFFATVSGDVKLFTGVGSIVIIIFTLSYLWMKKNGYQEIFAKFCLFIAIAFLFVKAVLIQNNFVINNIEAATLEQSEHKSYKWLRENTPPGSVVGSPSFTTQTRALILTNNKILVPNGFVTTATNQELLERLFFIDALYGVTPENFGKHFTTEKSYPPKSYDEQGISHIYIDEFRATAKGSIFTNKGFIAPVWEDEMHKKKVDEYRNYLRQKNNKPFAINYLYYGPREKQWGKDPKLLNQKLRLVYQENGIKIYEVTSDPRKK